MFNFLRNKRGLSIVEVIVAGAMTSIVSLGIATMMQNSFKEQRRLVLMETLRSQKIKFETLLRDSSTWDATLNGNTAAPFSTLKTTTTQTTQIAGTSPAEYQIYNPTLTSGTYAVLYDLLGPASTTASGFTEKGAVCSGFSTVSGNDSCPISYRLLVSATCPNGTSPCSNPQLKLVARLVYAPTNSGTLQSFANQINAVAGSDISDSVADGRFDAVVKRSATSVNRSFRLTSGWIPTAGGCSTGNGGGGQCSASGTVLIHPRTNSADTNTGMFNDSGANDPTNLVTVGTGGNFSFNETGQYGCVITVPAFNTRAFTAYLKAGAITVAQSTVNAGQWSSATAVIDTKFNVSSTATNYSIHQTCEYPSTADGAGGCSLGFAPTANYGSAFTLVAVSCYKLDKSM